MNEAQNKMFRQVIDSLAGPSDEEFDKKFQELANTAGTAANAGRDKEAGRAAWTMLLMAGAKALKSPGPDLRLAREASRCESAGDWTGAEESWRRLLALHKRSGCVAMAAKARWDLSRLLRLLGRVAEAYSDACAACQSARQADLAPLTVMTLENRALCALERKDGPRALADAEEALRLIKPERVYNVMRLRTLTLRAQCRLECGDTKGAESDLKSARKLEPNLVFSGMGGAIAARARRLEIQAELHIQQGRLTRAAHDLQRAIALRRRSVEGCCGPSPYSIPALARALERLAGISKRLGDEAGEEAASHEAETLRRQAHLPLASAETGSAARSGRRRGPGNRPKHRTHPWIGPVSSTGGPAAPFRE